MALDFRVSDPEKDFSTLVQFLQEPGILRWFPMCNEKEVEDSVKSWLAYSRLGAAITAEKDGTPVGFGNLYLNQQVTLKYQALFSIIVDPKERNQGFGKEIIEYMIQLAKEKFNLKLLHLEVYTPNPAKRLYERMGFVQYGVHSKFLKEEDGTYRDKELMQMTLH